MELVVNGGHLNVIAEKLCQHNVVIETEWFHQGIFNLICEGDAHSISTCLPPGSTSFSGWCPHSHTERPGSGSSELIMGGSGHSFPLTPLMANVLNKILSHDSRENNSVSPRIANMSWFWDLVSLSS